MTNNSKQPKLVLGKVLKTKGMTKYEFSKRLGVQTSNSTRYFDKDYNPTFKMLIKWAEAIGCKVSDLIED